MCFYRIPAEVRHPGVGHGPKHLPFWNTLLYISFNIRYLIRRSHFGIVHFGIIISQVAAYDGR
jgi:hypothetical protein